MKINKPMRALIASCFNNENLERFEVIYDNRFTNGVSIRIFMTETDYLLIESELENEDNNFIVTHYSTVKSFYAPVIRIGYINRYFKKYRLDGVSFAVVPIRDFINILNNRMFKVTKASSLAAIASKGSLWHSIYRASGGF